MSEAITRESNRKQERSTDTEGIIAWERAKSSEGNRLYERARDREGVSEDREQTKLNEIAPENESEKAEADRRIKC